MGQMRAIMLSRNARLRLKVTAALAIAALSAIASPVFARSEQEKVWRKACTADAFSLCTIQALSANRNGVRDCLLKKIDKVSDGCVAVIRAASLPPPTVTASAMPTTATR
jgi:hypothetical protein